MASTAVDGGSADASDGSAIVPSMDGAVVVTDSSVADASADGGSDASVAMCKPAKALAVCDPVANTGCLPWAQCDIDSDAKAQAGRCVSWFPALSGCDSNALTTSCDPSNTCVMGACKKLCYCDKDCTGGTKCTGTPTGPAGVAKFCQ